MNSFQQIILEVQHCNQIINGQLIADNKMEE